MKGLSRLCRPYSMAAWLPLTFAQEESKPADADGKDSNANTSKLQKARARFERDQAQDIPEDQRTSTEEQQEQER